MQKDQCIQIRLTKEEKEKIEKKAKDNNFYSVSQYIRFMAIHGAVSIK